MVDVPWRGNREESPAEDRADDAIVACKFQDGTLLVYEDRVHIERSSRSKFSDKRIDLTAVQGVTYSRRFVISFIQIEQAGVETAEESLLSTPVDENTLHFGRGMRECAERARDAILERTEAT